MGPLDVFLGWQPLVLAVLVYMVTQFVKAILDTVMGKEKRKQNRVVTRVVLPAVPPVLGALLALAPMHPQSIVDFTQANEFSWPVAQLIFSAWGACCGQFADYSYSKLKSLFTHETPDVGP